MMPLDTATEPLVTNANGELPLISARGVRKKFCRDLRRSLHYGMVDVANSLIGRRHDEEVLRKDEFWAVDGVSFDLYRGESLGLLGRNGSGKSTLLRLIAGQRKLSAGQVTTRGRIVSMTELGLGFDPSMTGRENIYINGAVHGFSRQHIDTLVDEIIDFAGIPQFMDTSVGAYSSGMRARLGFAIATHLEPDVLIADEVLAVGDTAFRRKCIDHIAGYIERGGSLVVVAHDAYLVQSLCNRSLILTNGRMTFSGTALDGVREHFETGYAQELEAMLARGNKKVAIANDDIGVVQSASAGLAAQPLTEAAPVAIDRFEVVDAEDGSERVRCGRAAIVRMYYRSQITASVSWGFAIETANRQTRITTMSKGIEGVATVIEPGEHRAECVITKLPLRPGVYAICGGITVPPTMAPMALLGFDGPANNFIVSGATATREENVKLMNKDLVEIDVEWLS